MSIAAHKEQVRRFYEVLWNDHDLSAMPEMLHEKFVFRGSLGDEKRGHDGLAEYVNKVHAALDDYRCDTIDLVAEGNKVFARMRFSGKHRDTFMGYEATGEIVEWVGCAQFTFVAEKVAEVWVLGDLKGLEQLLESQKIAARNSDGAC